MMKLKLFGLACSEMLLVAVVALFFAALCGVRFFSVIANGQLNLKSASKKPVLFPGLLFAAFTFCKKNTLRKAPFVLFPGLLFAAFTERPPCDPFGERQLRFSLSNPTLYLIPRQSLSQKAFSFPAFNLFNTPVRVQFGERQAPVLAL